MSVDADIPEAPDPWAERRLEILSELAEAGLEIAHALKDRIVEAAADAPSADNATACADLSRAFDRTARAVRLSVALRDRLAKDDALAPAPRPPVRESRTERADRVRRIVRRVLKGQNRHSIEREALDDHARERLYDADITGDLAGRSIGELVAQICADLCISPPWLALAEEAWAQAEIAERPPGSPYAAWPDLPQEEPWDPEDDLEDDPEDDQDDDPDDDPWDEDEPDDPGGGGPGDGRCQPPPPRARSPGVGGPS